VSDILSMLLQDLYGLALVVVCIGGMLFDRYSLVFRVLRRPVMQL